MTLDFSRCRLPPFAHQRVDTETLTKRPFYFIASQMRTGKTKIVIDAAQFLFYDGTIDRVLVVAPAPVRDVWYDPTLGELAKHLWKDAPATVTEFHARDRSWTTDAFKQAHQVMAKHPAIEWLITNYEFIRAKNRLIQLLPFCGPRTLLVLDESSFVKNWKAEQTKACLQLRRACGRVVLLNGTPLFHSPMDLFSQGNLLHPSVLDCKYVTHFRARYARQEPILGYGGKPLADPRGRAVQKIVGWTNLEDLRQRFAPHTVRRMQADCLDLPPKLDPVTLTATLDTEWPAYKAMRDEMVVWLKSGDVAISATAAVKVMRLSQITSGFLGGVEGANIEERVADGFLESIDLPGSFLDGLKLQPEGIKALQEQKKYFDGVKDYALRREEEAERNAAVGVSEVQEIGRAKLDVLLWFLGQRLEEDEDLKVVAWCRFRPELARLLSAVADKFPQFTLGEIRGGQKKPDRFHALSLLKPETAPPGPVFVGGTYGSGSFGLDFTAAHTSVSLSTDYSPGKFAQSADRVYGPGQTAPVAYFDIVAMGPKGQRTIDHAIVAARRAGEDVAAWTTSAWVRALEDE